MSPKLEFLLYYFQKWTTCDIDIMKGVVMLKTLFILSSCLMVAITCWAFATEGIAPCFDFHQKWGIVTLMNFYINIGTILAWMIYKESSWIRAAVFIPVILFAGSPITSGYIAMQLFKLSQEESSKDPIYFVLVRHNKEDAMGKRRNHSVFTAKVIISALGCLMLATFFYVLIIAGSPFHAGVFSRCMIATQSDTYFCIITLAVWVAYKESSWISAFFWILSLVCFEGIATCLYIVRQLFYLSPQQPISAILVNNNNRDFLSSDPLLMAQSNV